MREFDCDAVRADRDVVAAFVVPAVDQHPADAGRARFSERDTVSSAMSAADLAVLSGSFLASPYEP
jgi:hypothetical protein